MNVKRQNALCAVLLLAAASTSQMTGQTGLPLPKEQKAVEVFLTATGSDSPGLPSLSNLSVYVDKRPTQVVSLRSAKGEQLTFALLVDVSTSQSKNADSIRDAAWQIFEGLSNGNNRGYLVFFENRVLISKAPVQKSSAQLALKNVKFGGGTAIFDAIGDTCTQVLKSSLNPGSPRRVIVLLSDGDDNQSRLTAKKAEEAAEGEGVAIFTLSTSSTGAREDRFLKEASQKTGGQTIIAHDLGEGVRPLLAAIDDQWAITLLPLATPDRELHSLEIKNAEKEVRISSPARISLQ